MTEPSPAAPLPDPQSVDTEWLDSLSQIKAREHDPVTAPDPAARSDAGDGAVLGEDARAAILGVLVPLYYSEWDDGEEVGKAADDILSALNEPAGLDEQCGELVRRTVGQDGLVLSEEAEGTPLHGPDPDPECPCYPQFCTCDVETLWAEVRRLRALLAQARAEERERIERAMQAVFWPSGQLGEFYRQMAGRLVHARNESTS